MGEPHKGPNAGPQLSEFQVSLLATALAEAQTLQQQTAMAEAQIMKQQHEQQRQQQLQQQQEQEQQWQLQQQQLQQQRQQEQQQQVQQEEQQQRTQRQQQRMQQQRLQQQRLQQQRLQRLQQRQLQQLQQLQQQQQQQHQQRLQQVRQQEVQQQEQQQQQLAQQQLQPVQPQQPPEPKPHTLEKSKRQSKHTSIGPDSDISNSKRRSSKLGLLSLFNRSKITFDLETPQEKLEPQRSEVTPPEDSGLGEFESAFIPPETELTPIQEAPDSPLQHRPSRGALRNKSSPKESSSTTSSTWNAPPLFQAYPQSIKHATLRAPLMSAEAILRLSKERNRANEIQDSAAYGDGEELQKKDKKLRKSSILDTVTRAEWIDKVYILVTAGYLLQYAGHGAYDRVPEKILQLSDTSAAFVSDAIPGKPFVLQISQVSNEDGTIDPEMSRSMFKKMGGLRGDMRRSVANFLLVLENPEEMGEWLMAVRKEIEALGGREYNPEMPWDEDNAEIPVSKQPHRMPSQRYLVTRNPHQFDKLHEPPHNISLGDKAIREERPLEITRTPAPITAKRQSMATQESKDSRYVSDTQASIDQVHLDRLRESYASTGENTNSTSRDSSPQRSPFLVTQDTIAELPSKPFTPTPTSEHAEMGRLSMQKASDLIANRESLQPTPTPKSRPISTAISSLPERTVSPTPNFSVPSFSKRYSAVSASPSASTKTVSTVPVAIQEDSPNAKRDDESHIMEGERSSTLGELQAHYRSSPGTSTRIASPPSSSHLSTPPTSSHSHERPSSSSDGDRSYSRRFSSLDYARGISPVKPTHHCTSPHPPPTATLPPLPKDGKAAKRFSAVPRPTAAPTAPLGTSPGSRDISSPPLAPPPTIALPPVPKERRASSRASTPTSLSDRCSTPQPRRPSPANSVSPFPPPTAPLPEIPSGRRSSTPSEKHHSSREGKGRKRTKTREPRRPTSIQVPGASTAALSPLPQTAGKPIFTIEHQAASFPPPPTSNMECSSPPIPSRAPPPPPSTSPLPPPTITQPPPPLSQASKAPAPPALTQATSSATGGPPPAQLPPPLRTLPPQTPPPATAASPPTTLPPPIKTPRPPIPRPVKNAPPPTPPPAPQPKSLPSRPPTPPKSLSRKPVPRIGRQPPPIYSPRFFSKNKTPVQSPISPATTRSPMLVSPITPFPARDELPRPFIPPLKISHTREKGSFDGPWNVGYAGSPKATVLDLDLGVR